MSNDIGPKQGARTVALATDRPVFFMFQPTRVEIVESTDLAEWETLMKSSVGLENMLKPMATGTVCLCGTPERRDDCDQLGM